MILNTTSLYRLKLTCKDPELIDKYKDMFMIIIQDLIKDYDKYRKLRNICDLYEALNSILYLRFNLPKEDKLCLSYHHLKVLSCLTIPELDISIARLNKVIIKVRELT